MSKKWYYGVFVLLIFATLLLGLKDSTSQNSQLQNTDQASGGLYEPKILVSDNEKIILEFELPPLNIRDGNISGVRGQLINLVNYSQSADPGKPQLPLRGFTVGIPENANPTIRVLEQQTGMRSIPDIPPAPRIRYNRDEKPWEGGSGDIIPEFRYERDNAVYGRNEYYPKQVAKLGKDGIMRGQRIQTFQVSPVQFNPVTKTIKYYTKLKIAVYYNGGSALQKTAALEETPEAFENIFKSTLLNYEIAKNWRIGRAGLQKTGADDYFLNQGSKWCKLYLETPGIYVVEKADLDAAGFDLGGANINNLKMFNKGVEIAIRVDDGNSNGVFDDGDYVEFYGTAFKNYYTTTNVYWLTEGNSAGKRMAVKDGTPIGNYLTLIRGLEKLHYEKDKIRRADFPGHTDQEKWFLWYSIAPMTNTYNFNIANLSDTTASSCTVRLVVQGISEDNGIINDHHSIVKINNTSVLDQEWEGRIKFDEISSFEQAILLNGDNTVEIIAPNLRSGLSTDWQWIDYFEIEYWRDFITTNDSLCFRPYSTGIKQLKLAGFSNTEILVFDLTNEVDVKVINGYSRLNGEIRFQDDLDLSNRYIAINANKRRKPKFVELYHSSNLRNTNNRADYIILTHENFLEPAQRFLDYKDSNGLVGKVVTTSKVYDEFGYGFYAESPIKDFLTYTYDNWSFPAPQFVLLLGDASWNPRILSPEYYGEEKSDFIPTRLFEAVEDNFEASSDSWFGTLSGNDVLPEILIGRIPCRTIKTANIAIDKLINYETAFESGSWNRTATFVADNGEGGVMAFEDSSDAFIRDIVPGDFIVKRAYLSELGISQVQSTVKNAFDNGTLIMNYFGHGSSYVWAAEKIFTKNDVEELRNDNRTPFVLTLSCVNGYFLEPIYDYSCLAEVLFREKQRGAITVFSGSGEAYPSPVLAMGRKVYSNLFQEHNTTVGSFSTAGLVEMYARYPDLADHVMFYILFGDPATKLHYQPSINYVSAGFEGSATVSGAPAEQGVTIIATIKDQPVGKTTVSSSNGSFGPFYISPDNPGTALKDGGAPGDTIIFKAALASTDTVRLYPYALWKGGEVQKLTLNDALTGVAGDVQFEMFVDNKKVGEEFFQDDPVPSDAVFSAKISASGQLDASMIQLFLNEELVDVGHYSVLPDKQNPLAMINLTYQPQGLSDGFYELRLQAVDANGLAAVAEESMTFRVQSALALESVVNFPNPMDDETKFTFVLQNDKSAHVRIKIYTVAGRLIRDIDAGYMDVSYNESELWDGTDEYGDKLANGTYFYKIIADDGDEKAEVIEKLVVMR